MPQNNKRGKKNKSKSQSKSEKSQKIEKTQTKSTNDDLKVDLYIGSTDGSTDPAVIGSTEPLSEKMESMNLHNGLGGETKTPSQIPSYSMYDPEPPIELLKNKSNSHLNDL